MGEVAGSYVGFSDEALVGLLAESDAAAFEELYRRYSNRLLAYFHRMLGDEMRAQDCLQESFLTLIQNHHRIDTRRSFTTWLFTVAHNLCCNEHRRADMRRKSQVAVADFDSQGRCATAADEGLELAQFSGALLRELEMLDDDKRSAFVLRFQEGLSINAISLIMNCPSGTTKSRLYYATRLLAQRLAHFDPKTEQDKV